MNKKTLVSLIQKRRPLWGINENYHLRQINEIMMDEIRTLVMSKRLNTNESWEQIERRFQYEFEIFLNHTSDNEIDEMWYYFNTLLNLSDSALPRNYAENVNQIRNILEWSKISASSVPTEESEKKDDKSDSDQQFLISLLPYLQNIPEDRKMIVRTKLQQVFVDDQIQQTANIPSTISNDIFSVYCPHHVPLIVTPNVAAGRPRVQILRPCIPSLYHP